MTDLELQISKWRRDMLAAGIATPVPLEELESHLRDCIEAQIAQGMSPPDAFAASVARLGTPNELAKEFASVRVVASHSRIQAVLLAALAVQLAATAGMFAWLSQVSAVAGPVDLPRTPDWILPWHATLGFLYLVAITATLLARHWRPDLGQRMTRWLNWALLPLLPFGTLLGIYGLWITRRDIPTRPSLTPS